MNKEVTKKLISNFVFKKTLYVFLESKESSFSQNLKKNDKVIT
jgi:hypothetical protein